VYSGFSYDSTPKNTTCLLQHIAMLRFHWFIYVINWTSLWHPIRDLSIQLSVTSFFPLDLTTKFLGSFFLAYYQFDVKTLSCLCFARYFCSIILFISAWVQTWLLSPYMITLFDLDIKHAFQFMFYVQVKQSF